MGTLIAIATTEVCRLHSSSVLGDESKGFFWKNGLVSEASRIAVGDRELQK